MDFYTKSFNSIKNYNSSLKDSSIKAYLQSIKKINKELFNSDRPSIQYLKDHNSIIEYLDTLNLATKKGICTALIVLIKSTPDFDQSILKEYSSYHKKVSCIQNDHYLDNEKTDKEQKNWISREDIKNKIKTLEERSLKKFNSVRLLIDNYQMYLVLNLYTLIPPLRNDYALIKIIKEETDTIETLDKKFNYINITTGKLFLCNYKTEKHYGIKTIDIPDKLLSIIKNYVSIKKDNLQLQHNFLLINTTNLNPMTTNGLTKYINKIFYPKKVSTTLLRKIYISEQFPVTNTIREMQDASYIMGHDIGTARKVYAKIL